MSPKAFVDGGGQGCCIISDDEGEVIEGAGTKKDFAHGGAGFIGSHLAEAFLRQGHEVAVVDNLSSGRREQVPAGAQFYLYDIQSQETFDLIGRWRPQVLAHHAAQMSVRLSVEDPVMDARENILGSLNLFQAAARVGMEKILFASTGGAMYGDQAPVPAREEDLALRYANVYGPRQNGLGEAGVVAIFIEKFLAGEQLLINGDGLQTRDFVCVEDVVAANLAALDYHRAGVFNIGTGRETDILMVYRQLQGIIGSPRGPAHGPAKPGEQRRSALDSTRARKLLDWQPRLTLAEGLARTVAAFRERG
jgi:UDP-glucose 4-epimerase